jgi:1-acyl-sn-glycerol-3-phosphate acyltransferase
MNFWYSLGKNIVRTYLAFFVDEIRVWGQKNIPQGAKIVVVNHSNASDPFIIPFVFPERIHFLIQGNLFKAPLFGRILALADQIPVLVGQGKDTLKVALEKLAHGETVVIFPEGKLNHGDELYRGRSGAAVLALQSGAPLLPVGIYVPPNFLRAFKGKYDKREAFGRWQFGGSCYVRIGEPLLPTEYTGGEEDLQPVQEMTTQMMERISVLVHQAMEEANNRLFALPERLA